MAFKSGMREECAVFGCIAAGPWPSKKVDVAEIIFNGLLGLQHRGQESSGMVVGLGTGTLSDAEMFQDKTEIQSERDRLKLRVKKGMGLVGSIFTQNDLKYLGDANLGLGHNRYSTGGSDLINCQPLVLVTQFGEIALAHNGEIVNAEELRKELFRHGGTFTADSDTEMIGRLLMFMHKDSDFYSNHSKLKNINIAYSDVHNGYFGEPHNGDAVDRPTSPEWGHRIMELMSMYPLAYSFLLLHQDAIYAVRDCFGNRPLILGQIPSLDDKNKPDAWIVASESCCFKTIGCKPVREVLPGEIVKITIDGFKTVGRVPPPINPKGLQKTAFCLFEYVYFARADSIFEGQQVYSVRERCGRQLAIESPVEADIVSNVPDSATAAAFGFAKQSGIPYKEVLIKNPYVGRTFIQPSNRLRQLAVSKKFGALTANYHGKRIVIIDDSIVRGNTLQAIVSLLKETGAAEVHVRAACPPVRNPCYMGVNIPTKAELIANQMDIKELPKYFGAASVSYLSIDGLLNAVREGITDDIRGGDPQWKKIERGHCSACLTGEYPVELNW